MPQFLYIIILDVIKNTCVENFKQESLTIT